ncbi:type II toxin-antitoxin system HicB family antitoxin [Bacillus sp. REN16]|uniref:type II toxin-antitoxin system HicB family antitoxin n=1 Tax=Bacillus sp. REN16 TaxID=2887296 RepID=UPI001E49C14F|nr:type II toxin-antitoxin system HicB family antitoxin [Bacillus sp. REN16]MCC3359626.1 type II toxin-antitoxin system HicB family antitoxin [Bacillus sp. REN16]
MNQNYTYPIVLDLSDAEYVNILFPDFDNVMTCVLKSEDYISAAQDFLALTIKDFEDDQRDLPNYSSPQDIELGENQQIIYVNIWMPYHRSKIKDIFVKKTLTIPSWLDILAKKNNVNFSKILVKALKDELKLK